MCSGSTVEAHGFPHDRPNPSRCTGAYRFLHVPSEILDVSGD